MSSEFISPTGNRNKPEVFRANSGFPDFDSTGLIRRTDPVDSCLLNLRTKYDVVIAGAGHNGLVAAGYLAQAGKSVLMLEKNPEIGGATKSARIFDGVDAKISVYSYLVSLFPRKIAKDLGIDLQLKRRKIASYTPDGIGELLVSNVDESVTRDSFHELTGTDRDYLGYLKLQEAQERVAKVIWPGLLNPLVDREALLSGLQPEDRRAFFEEPLGNLIESHLDHDLIRGMVFTDAKIGVLTEPEDATLLQNRTFLYHIIGRGTGKWQPPAGGMGALVDQLESVARRAGTEILTGAGVLEIGPGSGNSDHEVRFSLDGQEQSVRARFVLQNHTPPHPSGEVDREREGSVFKINLMLKHLPALKSKTVSAEDAFCGTFHIDEGYEKMRADYWAVDAGSLPEDPGCEIYCHSLTDPSILGEEVREKGWQTLTCFGLDAPYGLFESDNEALRQLTLERAFRVINEHLT
ncbi:MAG: NAD(P)/FAD-dependent oxidoreductase, partial [Verrucomicrobiales bacterium]|nr:NAD(P)/FAD-dependent oxidoreductase [Verrucomicrobiales bacterium]